MTTLALRWRFQIHLALSKLKSNGLVNAGIWIGLSNIINIAAVFVIQKVIAVQVGPAGVAIVGQYQNFLGITTSLANGGINSGIVKYVAEYRRDTDRNALLISNATRITLFCSAILAAGLLLFAEPLSLYLFQTDAYTFILRLFGLTITLFALNTLLVSVLNGFGEIRKYAGSAIARSVVGIVLTVAFSLVWGLTGALVALTIVQSLVFFVTLFFVVRSPWFTSRFFVQHFDPAITRKLLAFSLMTLTSAVLVPLVQILVRNHLIATLSLKDAGYWDAMWKISQGYLSIVTGTLGVYYLPKLSSLQAVADVRREIWSGYKLILPALLIVFPLLYVLRLPIVYLLFSQQFTPTAGLFLPTLIGDFFKITSWLTAYLMMAKAMTRMFIVTQLVFSTITYSLSVVMINAWGLQGVAWAHAIKFAIYTVVVSYLLREYLFKRYEPR
jgi:O-antigen/teichoic acid export membrane protein